MLPPCHFLYFPLCICYTGFLHVYCEIGTRPLNSKSTAIAKFAISTLKIVPCNARVFCFLCWGIAKSSPHFRFIYNSILFCSLLWRVVDSCENYLANIFYWFSKLMIFCIYIFKAVENAVLLTVKLHLLTLSQNPSYTFFSMLRYFLHLSSCECES